MMEYLPPLLQTVSPTICGGVVTCAANQTCLSSTLKLVYGRDTATVRVLGCAGVDRDLNCVDLKSRYYHPQFDLEDCVLSRCSGELCNDEGISPVSSSGERAVALGVMLMVLVTL
eukprot:sb/3476716/